MKLKSLGFVLVFLLFTGCVSNTTTDLGLPATGPSEDFENGEDFENVEPQATGTTYYVSGTGNDTNNGLSETTPFKTLQKAANLTNPGDRVLIMNGTYSVPGPNTHVLDIQRGGSVEGGYIEYKNFSGHTPRIKVSDNYTGIKITAPYIIIDGLIVEGDNPNLSYDEAYALAIGTDAEAALYNTKFNSSGIVSYPENGRQPHHLIIRNNTVFNLPGAGIGSNGSDYVRIENNTVYDNSYYSPFANSGISFYRSKAIDSSTETKMYIRRNVTYGNINLVPRWYSNSDPAQRKITDGNGIIVDESYYTEDGVSYDYPGKYLIDNNVTYNNGGRGINIFTAKNVTMGNNTVYKNGVSNDGPEIIVGNSSALTYRANIFVTDDNRQPIFHYNSSDITFSNNIFFGGNEPPQFPPSTVANLIKNATFTTDLSDWGFSKTSASNAQNTRDASGKNCASVGQLNSPNRYDAYIYQRGFPLRKNSTYTLTFDVSTTNQTEAEIAVKLGGSTTANFYQGQAFSLPVNTTAASSQTLTFKMTSATDTAAQLEFQVAGNAEPSYFCFDNVVLTEDSNYIDVDPKFVAPSLDPATADFRLQQSSPAVDAQFVPGPNVDILSVSRPQGAAYDIGAYESY
ncbi:MAG: right-handed parallel beta-helix repeat-containing protein [Trueperaceae bacterium]